MTCQCRFITYNECSILVGAVDTGGNCATVREVSVLATQFCREPKTVVKVIPI